jgi:myo-inositol-1(or 4)-monophosphatase
MDITEFSTSLARQAGKLLLQYYQPGGIPSRVKSDHTVVTEADLAADKLIRSAIQKNYPDDGILSEEARTVYPAGKSAVWVIDPLDGTTNFSLGLHYWGVSIAYLVGGVPHLGALYFPLLDELFTATKGDGAFLNGSQLQVKAPDPSHSVTFFSCCSRTHNQYDVRIRYKTRILGSAAYGLATIARGSAILAFEVTPKVWDFSASWLIIREAGGVINPLNGPSPFPLQAGVDYEKISYPFLAAASQELWNEGQENLRPR